jgi:hypothetical protein
MTEVGPVEPVVERIEQPDGRYVLYFSWPSVLATDEVTDVPDEPDADE